MRRSGNGRGGSYSLSAVHRHEAHDARSHDGDMAQIDGGDNASGAGVRLGGSFLHAATPVLFAVYGVWRETPLCRVELVLELSLWG